MNEESIPVLYEYAHSVYSAMKEESTLEPLGLESEEEGLVYEGYLTKLVTQNVGLSIPYYTATTRVLKDMGCIVQLRRGGSTTPSRWLLVTEPTLKRFNDATAYRSLKKTADKKESQRINDLNSRLNSLEEKFEVLWTEYLATRET